MLLIYTGGTLGMTKLPDGSLAPERGGLARAIREMLAGRGKTELIKFQPTLSSADRAKVHQLCEQHFLILGYL